MRRRPSLAQSAWLLTLIVLGGFTPCYATIITYGSSFEFSGGTPPAGPTPWVTTVFNDGGTAGSVTMTLAATNLTGSEFVGVAMVNLDPSLDPKNLLFSSPTKVGSFNDPAVLLGANAFKAGGDGYFDIKLDFATSHGAPMRFTFGDSVTYTITGIPSLTADSFAFLSANGGGRGAFPVAQHVQSIGPGGNGSGWVTVPEAATISLLALGGLVAVRRKNR